MNKIKAAIIEDEVPAARLLHEMIQSLRPDWEVMILAVLSKNPLNGFM